MRLAFFPAALALVLVQGCGSDASDTDLGVSSEDAVSSVTLPKGAAFAYPFPAGATIYYGATYNGWGSTGHYNSPGGGAQDKFALDFQLLGEPDWGRGTPVLAVQAGKVVRADWTGGGYSNFGRQIALEHDLGETSGAKYYSMYSHLKAISVSVGQEVKQGDPIGELGSSCSQNSQHYDSCAKIDLTAGLPPCEAGAEVCPLAPNPTFKEPHLHFAVYRGKLGKDLAMDAWSVAGGQATIPEPLFGDTNFQVALRKSRTIGDPGSNSANGFSIDWTIKKSKAPSLCTTLGVAHLAIQVSDSSGTVLGTHTYPCSTISEDRFVDPKTGKSRAGVVQVFLAPGKYSATATLLDADFKPRSTSAVALPSIDAVEKGERSLVSLDFPEAVLQ